ncbi:MAG: hypothetical protein ABRQ23_00805 [Syntrophomonadaceae bacterium]
MALTILIPQKVINYTDEELLKWQNGEREECADEYCRRLPRNMGFGEFKAGQYFSELGYQWIHHDYNIFGGNKLGKYPRADEVLRRYFGESRFMLLRTISEHFDRFQEPDLMIYKQDYSELRFAECKRQDTRDKLDIEQVRGLAIIAALLECEVELFLITNRPQPDPEPLRFELPEQFGKRPENLPEINEFLQIQLNKKALREVGAVEAARWLDGAGLLKDSKTRPGKPLRDLLRQRLIKGQFQSTNSRWFIQRLDWY